MSEERSDALDAVFYGLATLFVVVAIILSLWGIRTVWHHMTYKSPEQKAAQAVVDRQAADEWAKDPTNPAVIARKCEDAGGTPTFSAWDGRVTDCKGVNDSKSVNVTVNQ